MAAVERIACAAAHAVVGEIVHREAARLEPAFRFLSADEVAVVAELLREGLNRRLIRLAGPGSQALGVDSASRRPLEIAAEIRRLYDVPYGDGLRTTREQRTAPTVSRRVGRHR